MIAPARPRAKARRPWTEAIPDRDERRRLKRLAILDSAARLFVERGFHETTLDDLASALAVTKPTLYYYVRSKEDILVQILVDSLAGTQAMFDAVHREGTDGLGRLRLFSRLYVEAMTHPAGRCLLTMRSTPLAPATRARLNAGFRRMDALVRELVREGIADGSIADCDVRMVTFALFGAINTVSFWYREGGSLSAAAAGEALFTVLERGLGAVGVAKSGNIPKPRTPAKPGTTLKAGTPEKRNADAAFSRAAKRSKSHTSPSRRKESIV